MKKLIILSILITSTAFADGIIDPFPTLSFISAPASSKCERFNNSKRRMRCYRKLARLYNDRRVFVYFESSRGFQISKEGCLGIQLCYGIGLKIHEPQARAAAYNAHADFFEDEPEHWLPIIFEEQRASTAEEFFRHTRRCSRFNFKRRGACESSYWKIRRSKRFRFLGHTKVF